MSSEPNKIYAEFATRGLDDVLKALTMIEDKVLGIEQKSKAVARMAAVSSKGTEGVASAASSAVHASSTMASANRQGNKTVANRAEADYRRFAKHVDSVKEVSSTMAGSLFKTQAEWHRKINLGIKATQEELVANPKGGSFETSPGARLRKLQAALGYRVDKDGAKVYKSPEEMRDVVADVGNLEKKNKRLLAAEQRKTRELKAQQSEQIANDRYAKGQLDKQDEKAQNKRDQDAKKALRQRDQDAKKAIRSDQGRREQFANVVYGAGVQGIQTGASIVGRAGQMAFNTVTNLGGGFSIDGALQENISNEKKAALLANKVPGGNRDKNKQEIIDWSKASAAKYGFDQSDTIDTLTKYVDKSGINTQEDFEKAKTSSGFMLKYAKAYGLSPEEVGSVAGQLKDQNPDLGTADLQQMMLDIQKQGVSGAVDIEDLLGSVRSITKTSTYYGGNQADNQRKLLAMAQVVSGSQGSTREGATALSNVSKDAIGHADAVDSFMNQSGFSGTFTKDHQISKPIDQFMGDVLQATGGDIQKIQYMGSDKKVFTGQTQRAFMQALQPFRKGKDEALAHGATEAQANKAGREAFDKRVADKSAARGSQADLDKDFASIMQTSAEQFAAAVRDLKIQVGEQLVPVLKDLIPPLRELTPLLVELLKGLAGLITLMANHPFEAAFATLGASITGEILKQIVAAKIGETIKSLIANGGMPVPGSAAAGASSATGAEAATVGLGTILGVIGAIVIQVGQIAYLFDDILNAFHRGSDQGDQVVKDLANGDTDKADKAISTAQGQYTTTNRVQAYGDIAQRFVTGVVNPGGFFGTYGTDLALSALGGTPSNQERRNDTLSAGTLLANDAVQKRLEAHDLVDVDAVKSVLTQTMTAAIQQSADNTKGIRQPTGFVFSRGPAPTTSPRHQ